MSESITVIRGDCGHVAVSTGTLKVFAKIDKSSSIDQSLSMFLLYIVQCSSYLAAAVNRPVQPFGVNNTNKFWLWCKPSSRASLFIPRTDCPQINENSARNSFTASEGQQAAFGPSTGWKLQCLKGCLRWSLKFFAMWEDAHSEKLCLNEEVKLTEMFGGWKHLWMIEIIPISLINDYKFIVWLYTYTVML